MTAPAFQSGERRAPGTPQLPRRRAVLMEQIRTTGLTLRGAALIAAALVLLFTLPAAFQSTRGGTAVDLHAWPSMLPGLLGALLPTAVWARDERFGPGFLWTLPVDRRRHALAKVLAGWVWLICGVAMFSLWLVALTSITGGRVLPSETLHVLTAPLVLPGSVDPSTLRVVRWVPSPLIWAVPFTAATGIYLLASALALGSRYPLRWVVGAVLSYTLLSVISQLPSAPLRWLAEAPGGALQQLVVGRYGLDALLTARTETLSTPATLTTGELMVVWRAVPELADWITAVLLWTGAGLLALWIAASRHRERRRA